MTEFDVKPNETAEEYKVRVLTLLNKELDEILTEPWRYQPRYREDMDALEERLYDIQNQVEYLQNRIREALKKD